MPPSSAGTRWAAATGARHTRQRGLPRLVLKYRGVAATYMDKMFRGRFRPTFPSSADHPHSLVDALTSRAAERTRESLRDLVIVREGQVHEGVDVGAELGAKWIKRHQETPRKDGQLHHAVS